MLVRYLTLFAYALVWSVAVDMDQVSKALAGLQLLQTKPLYLKRDYTISIINTLKKMILLRSDVKATRNKNKVILGTLPLLEVTSKVDLHTPAILNSMRKFTDPSKIETDYRGSEDPTINAWIDFVETFQDHKSQMFKVGVAFSRFYGLTDFETSSLKAWTDFGPPKIESKLLSALKKLPIFEGIVIRTTALDAPSLAMLEEGLKKGGLIQMDKFVKHSEMTGGHGEIVLATSSAGFPHYDPGWYNGRLIIYTKSGRLVAPISKFAHEGEVVIHSELVEFGFRVLGKGKSSERGGSSKLVYFLEEFSV